MRSPRILRERPEKPTKLGWFAMRKSDLPPIPKQLAGRVWKYVFVSGAFFAWGLLLYGLYLA